MVPISRCICSLWRRSPLWLQAACSAIHSAHICTMHKYRATRAMPRYLRASGVAYVTNMRISSVVHTIKVASGESRKYKEKDVQHALRAHLSVVHCFPLILFCRLIDSTDQWIWLKMRSRLDVGFTNRRSHLCPCPMLCCRHPSLASLHRCPWWVPPRQVAELLGARW